MIVAGMAFGAAICFSAVAFAQSSAAGGYDASAPRFEYVPRVMPPMSREAELNAKVQEALNKFTAAKDDEAKQAARKQLQGALTDLFDARQKEREEEIKQIEERVAKLRETLKKRESMRQELIEHHLTTLIQDAEGLGWGSDAGSVIGARAIMRAPGGSAVYRIEQPGTAPAPAPVPVVPRAR
jgi:hypothetical protein